MNITNPPSTDIKIKYMALMEQADIDSQTFLD